MEPSELTAPGATTSRKRGRSNNYPTSDSQRLSHLPPDSINPLSRSPGLLSQFSVAGLSDTDPDPSTVSPLFPHSGRGARLVGEIETALPDEADDTRKKTAAHGPSWQERHLHVLLSSIHQFLDRGEVSKAARAYGLILQLQPDGRPIDIRCHQLWAIGAEILMREGEPLRDEDGDGNPTSAAKPQRWGSAANMAKVKAYFETLIQQHPYDHRRPHTVCAADFWMALLRCEIYNVYTEHQLALGKVEDGTHGSDVDEDDLASHDGFLEDSPTERIVAARERFRQRAFAGMQDISQRMNWLAPDQPYSKSSQFHELLGAVFLYMADLAVPSVPASPHAMQQGREQREGKLEAAWNTLQKARACGAHLDPVSLAFLSTKAEEYE